MSPTQLFPEVLTPAARKRFVCHCLRIEEERVVDSIVYGGASCVREVMNCTGAGTGCTACHRKLERIVEIHVDRD